MCHCECHYKTNTYDRNGTRSEAEGTITIIVFVFEVYQKWSYFVHSIGTGQGRSAQDAPISSTFAKKRALIPPGATS